jgi:PIN domain nuclease of toxin-antitoxin system
MGAWVTTVLLDTHVLHWWSAEPGKLSQAAAVAVEDADAIAVAAISWYELAWLARQDRIRLTIPVRSWLDGLSQHVLTIGITPALADLAAALPESFPGDPADRLIYATALEHGWHLVTKDRRLRDHRHARQVTVW